MDGFTISNSCQDVIVTSFGGEREGFAGACGGCASLVISNRDNGIVGGDSLGFGPGKTILATAIHHRPPQSCNPRMWSAVFSSYVGMFYQNLNYPMSGFVGVRQQSDVLF